MELTVLMKLFPVVEKLIEKAPQIKTWFEERARKEDPLFFLQLQSVQATNEIKTSTEGLQSYMLTTAIMSAMLSNPKLTKGEIKQRFVESVEVADEIRTAIERIAPKGKSAVSG